MKIYKKQVKKHEEVWCKDPENGEARIQVCKGNSNYGRLYVNFNEYWQFLSEKETEIAFKLFKEIWEKNKYYDPFNGSY